jgi:hypothetical protein
VTDRHNVSDPNRERIAPQLIEPPELSKVSPSSGRAIAVSIKTVDAEQTASAKQKALRLFCRAIIRLYIRDHGSPELGKRLGIL